MTPFDYGDVARIEATITNASGALVDPASSMLRVQAPSAANVATYAFGGASAPIKIATGYYYVDHRLYPLGGIHRWRWETTGPQVAEEGRISVASSSFV